MVDAAPHRPARRPRRSRLIVALLVLLAAAWSAAWLLVSRSADAAFDAWLAAENDQGRAWTCPARHVGGYPFAIELRCERPTYRGEVAGRIADGVLEGLVASVRLDHPRRLVVGLRGPLNLRSEAEDFDFLASWETLVLTVDDLGAVTPRGGIGADRLAVTLATRQGDLNLRAATLNAEAAPAEGAPADAAFAFKATGVAFPTLDPLPGLDAPTDAQGRGVLHHADLLRGPTRARLDAWRQAGGSLTIASLDIAKGSFHGTATGQLALDEAHRPAGQLDASLGGFEPIAQHFGIPAAGVRLGGLLSSLLGGAKAAPATAGSVRMQLVLDGGGLFLGPFKTGVRLDPFY